MKKFKFKLDSLLRYRGFQEHQQKLAVAATRQQMAISEKRIEACETETHTTADTLESEMTQGIDSNRLQWFNDYLMALSASRASEEARHRELTRELIIRQGELRQKTIARKVVENLKLRKQEEYYREAIKLEQKELDDMVILRSAREAMQ